MKQLTEMSDEELGTLFPIILTEHKKDWAKLYDQEERILYDTIGKNIYRIDHIGSTAVEQLIAKPTIDILLEINGETNTNELIKSLESIGYIYSPQPQKPAPHMMFMKGYTLQGFQGHPFEVTDYDVPFIIIKGLGSTRPLDERAYNFCKKYSDSIMLVDCEDFDMTGIAESVREYFAPLVAGAVLRSLADEFAYQRGHDLGVRRYMWKMEY